jgi:hypothetical protein
MSRAVIAMAVLAAIATADCGPVDNPDMCPDDSVPRNELVQACRDDGAAVAEHANSLEDISSLTCIWFSPFPECERMEVWEAEDGECYARSYVGSCRPQPAIAEWRPIPVAVESGGWSTSWRVVEDVAFAAMCSAADGPLSVSLSDVTDERRTVVLAVQAGEDLVCIEPEDGALFDIVFEHGHRYELLTWSDGEPDVFMSYFTPWG